MKKGIHDSISDQTIAYIHGRIEREIEQIALATGIPFGFITQRIAELLHPLGPSRVESEVPLLRGNTTRRSATLATLEMVEHSHHDASSPNTSIEVQDHRRKAISARWTTKRRKEQAERARLLNKTRKAPKKASRKDAVTEEERMAKQKFYQARHTAKKARALAQALGKPLPPMPPLPPG
jgi:hypothetical protein